MNEMMKCRAWTCEMKSLVRCCHLLVTEGTANHFPTCLWKNAPILQFTGCFRDG